MNAFVPRSSTAVLAGLGEFPSCKFEAGDTDEAGLRRVTKRIRRSL